MLFSIMLKPLNEKEVLAEVYCLTQESTKNWRKLLKYGNSLEIDTKRKLLWVWPTEKSIWQINKLLREYNITNILSIGCGNGLFEWILKEALNILVYGIEVDRQWWHSSYAIKSFIPLNYIEDMKKKDESTDSDDSFLQHCCSSNNWNFALMFCYFNNRLAFLEYLQLYEGNYIIIVGPLNKTDIYTDPLPLEPNFPDDLVKKWLLTKSLVLDNNNVFVLYEKCIK